MSQMTLHTMRNLVSISDAIRKIDVLLDSGDTTKAPDEHLHELATKFFQLLINHPSLIKGCDSEVLTKAHEGMLSITELKIDRKTDEFFALFESCPKELIHEASHFLPSSDLMEASMEITLDSYQAHSFPSVLVKSIHEVLCNEFPGDKGVKTRKSCVSRIIVELMNII